MVQKKIYYSILFLFGLSAMLQAQTVTINLTTGLSNSAFACQHALVTATATVTPLGTYTYRWDMENGSVFEDTARSVQSIYTTPGDYIIELTVKSGGVTIASATKSLHIYKSPIADFTVTYNKICAGTSVVFTADRSISNQGDGVVSPDTGYFWDLRDGRQMSTNFNPSFSFTDPNLYSIYLRITDNNKCSGSIEKIDLMDVAARPIAGFIKDKESVCKLPDTVYFSAIPTSPGTLYYKWNFDGISDTRKNPSFIYSSYGTKHITLRIDSSTYHGCASANIAKDSVIVYEVRAEGDVWKNGTKLGATNSICYGEVICKNKSIGVINGQYKWDFGDGTFSYADSIAHNYDTPGTYTLKLIAMPSSECQNVKVWTITIEKANASFTLNPTSSCLLTQPVTISNQSTNATTYLWEFPDGSSSAESAASFNKTFTPGADADPYAIHNETTLEVKLNAFTASGCKSIATAAITFQRPTALFTVDTTSGCVPLPVKFKVLDVNGNGAIQTYKWIFDDGVETSTSGFVTTASHTYTTAGVYHARMILTNTSGCQDTSYTIDIKTGNVPHPKFTVTPPYPTPICATDLLTITDISDPVNAIDFWEYTVNGHRVGKSTEGSPSFYMDFYGGASIALKVGSNGCYNDTTANNVIYGGSPSGSIAYKMDCATPSIYNFTSIMSNATSYQWIFSHDASKNTSSNTAPVINYGALEGDYTATLTTYNGSCSSVAQKTIMVRNSKTALTMPAKTCAYNDNSIHGKGSALPNTWCHDNFVWSFTDSTKGERTDVDSIHHTFTAKGVYRVKLSVSFDNGCTDTISKAITINAPNALISATPTEGCLPLNVLFTDMSTPDVNPIKNWHWRFDDGSMVDKTSGGHTIPKTYITAATHPVILEVTDDIGCVGRDTLNIIGSAPDAQFYAATDSFICFRDQVLFSYNSNKDNVLWNFGDGYTSTETSAEVKHVYTKGGIYTVKLKVTYASCTDSFTLKDYITVYEPDASYTLTSLDAGYQTNDSVFNCYPVNIKFTHLFPSLDIIYGEWDYGYLGSTWSYSPSEPVKQFLYNIPGSYNTQLSIIQTAPYTANGFCTDSSALSFRVTGPAGAMDITPQNTCREKPVTFSIKDTANVSTYGWDFGDGAIKYNLPSITHTFALNDTIYNRAVKLLLNNKEGTCHAYIEDTVHFEKVVAIIDMSLGKADSTDTTICSGKSVLFKDITYNSASQTWYFGDGTYMSVANPVHGYAMGNYVCKLVATSQNGCRDTAYLPIHVFPTPNLKLAFDPSLCYENKALIRATPYKATTTWTPLDGLSFYPGDSVAEATPAHTTQYLVKAQYATGCSQSDSIVITRASATSYISRNDVAIGDSVHIIISDTSDVASFTWIPPTGFSCTTCLNPVVRPRNDKYYLILTEPKGCFVDTIRFAMNIDSVNIHVMAPTAFVPGDADNGIFKLVGSGLPGASTEGFKFEIFNRWGNLMFTTNDKDQGWDGTFKGKVQPIDSYVWVATVKLWDGKVKQYKGAVMIIK